MTPVYFAEDKDIFLSENCILNQILKQFIPEGPIGNKSTLVQILAWCQTGDKAIFWTNDGLVYWCIWVTEPQWVNTL